MKKNLMRLMTAVTLMFAATSVNAQDIGSILGSVLGGEQGEDAISGLTSIFSKDKLKNMKITTYYLKNVLECIIVSKNYK